MKPIRKRDGTNQFQYKIKGRSDSDYAKDMQTWQSILGYIVFLKDAPVMHRSATQKTVALSLCKAELNAAVLCVQDMLYAKNLIELIGLKVEIRMKLEINNKGVVDLINSFSVAGKRAKGSKAVGGRLDPRFREQHRHVHEALNRHSK